MLLPDVNVLVYAFREDSIDHAAYKDWLDDLVNGDEMYAISDLVLSSVVRIVTNPRIFIGATPTGEALAFAESLRTQPNCLSVAPGPRHWEIFSDLCRKVRAKANIVSDAYLAALAIESGSEWITADRDYARFPGLRWRHPLD
jgi:toxin-antitoxin system PIN domain toxin